MKQISIISDTHGLLREEVKKELASSDIILHGGDVNTHALVEQIKSYGQAYIVRGNNDKDWAEYLPAFLKITVEEVCFLIVHNKKDIPKNLTGVDVVIYGHSHKYESKLVDGILFLNPGSCGKRRFDLEISMCRMVVEGHTYAYEKVVITP
ncbi:metallophosphoesterase family protein [Anaerotignum sp.]|uniref:metallophosphoesterase family protein n=1 Tax=Anaerotignum sp. TaxID=2039241 RepID=UPI0028AFAD76|nr:metallophosphoesterase family protein [Anaerotignum sp.]